MRTVPPVSPGEMLDEEFLKPLGLTKYRLAKDVGVPPQRIGGIVAGKRSSMRLAKLQQLSQDVRAGLDSGPSDAWNPALVKRDGRARRATKAPLSKA